MSDRRRNGSSVPSSARGGGQLLDKPLTDLSGGRQAVGMLEFSQGLLGRGPLFPVWFDRVAQLSQGGLGGQNQARVAVGLLGQQVGDRIGRRLRACRRLSRARRGQGLWGLYRRSAVFRADRLWRNSRRRGDGGKLRRRRSEQGRRMALALQEKRVDADADKRDQQGRSEIILQMRDLHAPGDFLPQTFVMRALDRPSKLANIISYAGKR